MAVKPPINTSKQNQFIKSTDKLKDTEKLVNTFLAKLPCKSCYTNIIISSCKYNHITSR